MNKQYIVNKEGAVTVITDTEEAYTRIDKYTNTTEVILALENLSESIQNKKELFEKRFNEQNQIIRNNSKKIKILNAALIPLFLTVLIVSALISTKIFLSVLVLSIPITLIVGLIEKSSIEQQKETRSHIETKIKECNQRIDKIKRRINELEQVQEFNKTNYDTLTKIKPSYEYVIDLYNVDPSDKFVENYVNKKYQNECSQGKKLIKTKQKNKYNLEYEF